MNDLITRRQRIGYSSLRKNIAYAVGIAGAVTIFAMLLATAFLTMETKKLEAHSVFKGIIYQNIYNQRHK